MYIYICGAPWASRWSRWAGWRAWGRGAWWAAWRCASSSCPARAGRRNARSAAWRWLACCPPRWRCAARRAASIASAQRSSPGGRRERHQLAFTIYSFTSRLLCTNQSSLYRPSHLHLPHGCNTIPVLLAIFDSNSTLRFHAIYHTILCVAISCTGQVTRHPT